MNDRDPPTRAAIGKLLDQRGAGKTICPSEVARSLASNRDAPGRWREFMPRVHDEVDRMLAKGMVALSWRGKPLDKRSGPYRIARPATDNGKAEPARD